VKNATTDAKNAGMVFVKKSVTVAKNAGIVFVKKSVIDAKNAGIVFVKNVVKGATMFLVMKAGMPARAVPIAGITFLRKLNMLSTTPFIAAKTGLTTLLMKLSMPDTIQAFAESIKPAIKSPICPMGSSTPAV